MQPVRDHRRRSQHGLTVGHLQRRHPRHGRDPASPGLLVPAQRAREITVAWPLALRDPKAPCTTPSCRAAPDWSPARGSAASCVRHRRATSVAPWPGAGNRMPKMRERRSGQVVVGQRREYSIDRVGPSGEVGPDHVDRTFRSDEVGRPRQVEPPLQIGAARRPQAEVSVLADDRSVRRACRRCAGG